MRVDVLFAGIPVEDFAEARSWYEGFFDRPPDIVAHDEEVMWRITDQGWIYIVRDSEHAGNGIVAMAVDEIEAAITSLEFRGVGTGPIEQEGEAGRKALVRDPEGNTIAIVEVAPRDR